MIYLKPRLSRGFFLTGPNHAQHGSPNVAHRNYDPPATHDGSASTRATKARQREKGEDMWLAVAAITLLAAIGFIALAFAVQFER